MKIGIEHRSTHQPDKWLCILFLVLLILMPPAWTGELWPDMRILAHSEADQTVVLRNGDGELRVLRAREGASDAPLWLIEVSPERVRCGVRGQGNVFELWFPVVDGRAGAPTPVRRGQPTPLYYQG